ncbi:hypothetical protein JTE90_009135 [Oedothorax gibbosus]|uniref:Uncharacterized protein n=1 Tax=Oedothorax gibbosus TaxID=931172 RepID=A0AAV6TVZ2_9ARAC|nr:hypothetical protein JTE90_009135 [Oedothorax gibbosus]
MTKVGNLEQDGKGVPRDHDSEWYCKYFSSYLKITRMVAWIKRFIYNCKKTNHVKLTGELTALEIHAAEKNLLKLVQRESFTSKEDKRLAALDVYEDEQGLLRLKTKIVFKRDTEDFRCPVILPSDHVAVKRLISGEHQSNCHAGTQMLLNLLREHYLILNARKAIRSVIAKCVICLRYKQANLDAPAAALPENRTKEASIFEIIGVDLTGPLYLKDDVKEIGTPDFDVVDNTRLNKRLKHRQKLIADLRARFRSEYLGLLIQRPQHKKWISQISIGDIVLIGCDNVKRMDWPLGRVIEIIPGKDNVNRLVRLQTASSQLLRPIQRIFPLEVSSSWCKSFVSDVSCAFKMPDNIPSPSSEVPDSVPYKTSRGRVIKVPQRLDL